MLLLVSRGYGILVAPIVFFFLFFTLLSSMLFSGDPDYLKHHLWPLALTCFLSGVVCWFLGPWLEKRHSKEVFDPRLGKMRKQLSPTEFFFIPMQAWGAIFAVLGLLILTVEVVGPPPPESSDTSPSPRSTPAR